MYNKFFQLIEYYKYFRYAEKLDTINIDNAELTSFFEYLKSTSIPQDHYSLIKNHRSLSERNQNQIEHTDMGARAGKSKYIRTYSKVSKLAKKSSIDSDSGKIIYALVNRFKPNNILEFGTLLGLGTLHLALANPNGEVITMEGCAELSNIARGYIDKSHVNNTDIMTGEFSVILPIAIQTFKTLDFVYFDGNHRYTPTISYFNQCKSHRSENAIFVFDDIYWSKEMKKAWMEINEDKDVTTTIDTYHLGIVFFNKNYPKRNILLKI